MEQPANARATLCDCAIAAAVWTLLLVLGAGKGDEAAEGVTGVRSCFTNNCFNRWRMSFLRSDDGVGCKESSSAGDRFSKCGSRVVWIDLCPMFEGGACSACGQGVCGAGCDCISVGTTRQLGAGIYRAGIRAIGALWV